MNFSAIFNEKSKRQYFQTVRSEPEIYTSEFRFITKQRNDFRIY